MMKNRKHNAIPAGRRFALSIALAGLLLASAGCGHLAMMGQNVQRPAEEAFGLGPRVSINRIYTATLQPQQPLRVRRLQSVPVLITDSQGRPVEQAAISVDGGMPEHGHGLPTQPRVTHEQPDGSSLLEGMKFSMTGWWEVKLAIQAPLGADRVTFNAIVSPGPAQP